MAGRKLDPRLREALRWAQLSALVLGVGLLAWGLAPLIIQRIHTSRAPAMHEWASSGFTLLLGLLFIGLWRLIRNNVGWALWTAAVVSVALLLCAFALTRTDHSSLPALAPIVLATATALTNWLALSVRRRIPEAQTARRLH